MKHRALIILGMHRSGTSAFTGSLKCLGIELGAKLYAGHKDINAKGYWEHNDIVDTHDEILHALGSRWDDINPLPNAWINNPNIQKSINKINKYILRDFSSTSVWALKDPRMCRLLPLWNGLLKKQDISPFYVFISRHPLEVARSLERRNDFHLERSLMLWVDHNRQAEENSRGSDRVFYTYEQLLTQPKVVFESLENCFPGELPVSVTNAWPCIESFIETDLKHHSGHSIDSSSELELIATQLFAIYTELSQRVSTAEDQLKLDGLYQQFDRYYSILPSFLLQQIADLNKDYTDTLTLWNGVYHSYTWQLIRPFKYIERLIRDALV